MEISQPEYTDRDFLEDYAAFYARCYFNKYPPICARLHFFRGEIGEGDFRRSAGQGETIGDKSNLQEAYLGFIVVRPLPHAPIGRTCLRTYDCEGRRHFPVMRRCEAHLLGQKLRVESLPFQEQDTGAAACATSAIWSALQGTALLFQHEIYSPVEITRIATAQFPGLRRAIPNRGLNPLQMAAAIRRAGLEPEVVGVETKALLKATAYAYLKARIPVLMNVAMFDFSDSSAPKPFRGDWSMGHAVTIAGYSIGAGKPEPHPKWGTHLRATRLDRLYVHDDQVGPFARLKFDGPTGSVAYGDGRVDLTYSLATSWCGENKIIGSVCFVPDALIVPVYHKIRVDFDTILDRVFNFEEHYRKSFSVDLPTVGVEWDIYLTTATDFKADIRSQDGLNTDRQWRLLCKPLPRFLWVAAGYLEGERVLDLLFDATDVPGSSSLQIDWYAYGL